MSDPTIDPNDVLTAAEAVAALDAMKAGDDAEISHCNADEVLRAALRGAGLSDVADAFDRADARVGFWYA